MNCPLILRHESLVAILFCISAGGLAQEPTSVPDPFGTESKPTPAARPATKSKPEVQDSETNPTVLAIRNSNPQTAVDLLRATENLVNLSRPEDAKRYLRRLSASNFEPATLWSLQRQFGSALFLRLAREESIQPEGRTFAEAVLKASVQMSRDPARLDSLIRQLSDPSGVVRHGAMVELRGGGEAAAVALIQVLANQERSAEHPVIIEALTLLGGDAEGPLLATRDAPDEGLRQRALVAVGQLQTQATVPYLLTAALGSAGTVSQSAAAAALTQRLGGVPTRSAAERYLHQQARSYFDGLAALPVDHEDQVRVWRWDVAEQRPVEARVPVHQGELLIAGRIARELVALMPESAEYRRLYVGALLEQAKLAGGWEQPLDRADGTPFHMAAQLPARELETLLQLMLDKSHPAGAMAASEVLGAVATPAHLIQANGQPSVLCRALQNKERRVRFAALQAILEIDPRERYPGASFVPEALGFFANHSGSRRALVAHPRAELAQTLSGILQGLGLAADVAGTGHEALQKAAQAADWEFVLISDVIDRPAVGEMLQLLRREPRTARLPVAIL
ncbi:MAG: hypothetical protein AB7O38_01910, partial [Pirellulaceae bacterium]